MNRPKKEKNIGKDQWNRVESSEIDPYRYSQLMPDKRAKAIQ